MSNIPNQRRIRIKKPLRYTTPFYLADKSATRAAYKDLNGSAALGLYLYFLTNMGDFEIDLFKENVEKEMGIKRTAFYNGMTTLQEKGYLVYCGQNGCNPVYDFYESPQPKDA